MHMNIFVNQEKMHPYLVSSLFWGENIFYKVKEKTNTKSSTITLIKCLKYNVEAMADFKEKRHT